MSTDLPTDFVVHLISERFSPFATVGGPLTVGQVEFSGRTGTLYLTENRVWLFFGEASIDVHTLTDEEVAEIAEPITLIRGLLSSMTATIATFQEHLDRIESNVEDLNTLLGIYVSDMTATVVDLIALGQCNPYE